MMFKRLYATVFRKNGNEAHDTAVTASEDSSISQSYLNNLLDSLTGKKAGFTPFEKRYRQMPLELHMILTSLNGTTKHFLDESMVDTLNNTIDKITYEANKGRLGEAMRAGHRKSLRNKVHATLGYLKDIRKQASSHKVYVDIEDELAVYHIWQAADNKHPDAYTYEERFKKIEDGLSSLTTDHLTLDDLDKLAYAKNVLAKNSSLKRRPEYEGRRDAVIGKINTLLNHRDYLLDIDRSSVLKQYQNTNI